MHLQGYHLDIRPKKETEEEHLVVISGKNVRRDSLLPKSKSYLLFNLDLRRRETNKREEMFNLKRRRNDLKS